MKDADEACARRAIRAAGARTSLPQRRGDPRRDPADRRRRRAPGLRVPQRKARVRARRGRGRRHVRRAAARSARRVRRQDEGAPRRALRGYAAGPRHRRADRDRHARGDRATRKASPRDVGYPIVAKAVGGGGGIGMQVVQRRERHRARAQELLRPRQGGFADARVYLERYVDAAAAHRGADLLRRARPRVRARRARVQRAAPSPEDRRGVALAGRVLRGRGGREAPARSLRGGAARREEGGLRRRGDVRVHRRRATGTSSSSR